jgi:hypothetical protein
MASSAAANLTVNGGFENGKQLRIRPSGFSTLPARSIDVAGWRVTASDVVWVNGYWNGADRSAHSIDPDDNAGPAGIEQDVIGPTSGKTYYVTFDFSANRDSTAGPHSHVVDAAGNNQTYTCPVGSRSDVNWLLSRFICYGRQLGLDRLVALTVPEPATWSWA